MSISWEAGKEALSLRQYIHYRHYVYCVVWSLEAWPQTAGALLGIQSIACIER